MGDRHTTLVMAGAREAHGIVAGLARQGRQVIASLSEPERMFGPLPVPTRTGTFATPAEYADWVNANDVSKIIDASHAFDTGVSAMARQCAIELGLPYVRVLRPPWTATETDKWIDVASVKQVATSAPANTRLFSNTGWLSLPAFEGFRGERVFLRQTHAQCDAPPYDFVTILPGEPPFSVEEEIMLFRDLRVTHLICRNVGGEASSSKLLAARELGLPVYMVARQQVAADVLTVETIEQALAWDAAE